MRATVLSFAVLATLLTVLSGCTKDAPTTPDTTPKKYAVKGTVTPKAAEAVDGVAITMGTRTATTTATGTYSFSDVDTGSYVLTPSKAGITFTPATKSIKVSTADVTGVDFVATGAVIPTHIVPEMIAIEPGTFMLGSKGTQPGGDASLPQHSVTLTQGFWIGKTEITQAQYASVIGSNPAHWVGESNPVENVSAFDAMAYCNELSKKEGLKPCYTINGTTFTWDRTANGYRLPTNAEWEYAARAGTTDNTYAGLNNGKNPNPMVDSIAWYMYNTQPGPPYDGSTASTRPVGLKKPNAWGLYDVLGNLSELVYGNRSPYTAESKVDPIDTPSENDIIVRGGCCKNKSDGILITERIDGSMTQRGNSFGFRIARNR